MEEIIIFAGFVSIAWLFILTRFYLKLQQLKLHAKPTEGDNKDFRELKDQLQSVLIELEMIKEEQQQVKSLIINNLSSNHY